MDKGRYNISRKEAEAIVNNHTFCLIHNRPMVEYGEPDLCGTYATKCPQCEKEG